MGLSNNYVPHNQGLTLLLISSPFFALFFSFFYLYFLYFVLGDDKEKPVPDGNCKDRRPLTSQTCRAECDLDCTVSHWTQWTECKVTDCELYLRRRRTNEGTGMLNSRNFSQ